MGYRITFPLKVTITADLEKLKQDCKQVPLCESASIFEENGRGVIRIQTWAELVSAYEQLSKILLGCPRHEIRDEETGERVDGDVTFFMWNPNELKPYTKSKGQLFNNSKFTMDTKDNLGKEENMIDKTKQLNELFSRWKTSYGQQSIDFSEDGIINEEIWNKAHRKILFFMKDSNDYRKDLRDLFNRNPWQLLGIWSYGLQQLTTACTPIFTEPKKTENWQFACRSSAVINLKKLTGKNHSNDSELQTAGNRDIAYINEELEIIQPDIVVCCGIFHLVKDLFTGMEPKGPDGRIYQRGDVIWIDFIHPSFPNLRYDISYYALITLYQNYYRPWQREAGG